MLKFLKISPLLIGGIFLFIMCGNSSDAPSKRTPNPKFVFANNEVICNTSFDEQCFDSNEEYAIYVASEMEAQTLSFVEIDWSTEKEIGESFHNESVYKYVEDSRYDKLQRILRELKPYVSRKEVNYQVYLIQDPVINAWTVPGGRIYFTTGMLDFMQSDDEIANVLGHEIGHNECKHTHKQLKRHALAQFPLAAIGMQDIDASMLVNLYSTFVVSFGQHEEMESDRTGMYLSSKAGYDPEKGLDLWRRLAEQEQESAFDKLFRSHPYSRARYDCGKQYLNNHRK